MKVLVVDDSVVFRSQIKSALKSHPEFTDIDVAANGKIAIGKLEQSSYDLVVLDIEMPEMNGIETLKEMKKLGINAKTIVFSSLTARGAKHTMEALEHGACDFITKPQALNDFELALQHVKDELIPKALQFLGKSNLQAEMKLAANAPTPSPSTFSPPSNKPNTRWLTHNVNQFMPNICVVGSSTGGPMALRDLFSTIRGPLKYPILITQHMPPVFTKTLAKSIADQTGLPAKEAKHFEELQNEIYVAPGDFHLTLKKSNDKVFTVLDKRPKRNSVRPAVDFLFESVAEIYGRTTLGIVLTGMGSDGADGAVAIKNKNGCIVIQDENTSTVWGMPGAVHRVGAFDQMSSIQECAKIFAKLIGTNQ